MLIANAAPSIGSVPEPNSSTNTKEFSLQLSIIFTILDICDEKVLSESAILWLSPISANILSKTNIEDELSAGMPSPLQAIHVRRPTVFNVTVFPPVLGPVITNVLKSWPSDKEIGTAVFWSNNGCLALFNTIILSVFKFGILPLIDLVYLALAKIKSRFDMFATSNFNSFTYG